MEVTATEALPCMVMLKSDGLGDLPTRLVAPLPRSPVEARWLPHRLAPHLEAAGNWLMLKPQEASDLLARQLGPAVGSLRAESRRICNALDAVVSGV